MSIKFIDEFIIDIYLKKELINNVNFNNKVDLENYLKKLFKNLKNKYSITIEGFYDITIYIDKYYGVILHLEKDNIEYYDYFKNQVDMRLITIDTDFMYLVEDIPLDSFDKFNIIIKDKKIYLKIKKELTNLEMMNLLENSKVVYEV